MISCGHQQDIKRTLVFSLATRSFHVTWENLLLFAGKHCGSLHNSNAEVIQAVFYADL